MNVENVVNKHKIKSVLDSIKLHNDNQIKNNYMNSFKENIPKYDFLNSHDEKGIINSHQVKNQNSKEIMFLDKELKFDNEDKKNEILLNRLKYLINEYENN